MKVQDWTRWGVCASLLGLLACSNASSAGGGGTFVAKDAANAGDVAADDVAADDVATTPDAAQGEDTVADAAADAAVEVAAADVTAEDVAVDVAQDVKKSVKTIGAQVNPPLAAPTFTQVVDTTGAKVTPDALQGHWTVLWFYPAASTAG